MGAGKLGELTIYTPKDKDSINNDPIKQFQSKYKELENGLKGWVAKQSSPVEAAVITITSAAQGVAIGGIMGTLTTDARLGCPVGAASRDPQAMASFQQAQTLELNGKLLLCTQ